MKLLAPLILAAIAFSSCTTIYFEQPQPSGDPALDGFPKSFQGSYFVKDGDQTDTLFVEKDKFIYPENFKKSLPAASLDTISTMRIANGLLYDDEVPIDYGIPFTENNDSIHYDIRVKMAKKLSEVLVLKKFGKLLVLNEKEENKNYWNAYLIEKLKNGDLQVSAVGNFKPEGVEDKKGNFDGELKDFYSITSFKKLTDDSFLINPDKKAFQQLFNKGFFKKVEVYERVK
ncbi:hypothetical protein [Fulvivirga sp.]|uniref:hypothetical protein n=1 Tax=Fulvivirga sp. TaxID=1931237 RepID=UPI0032EAE939